MKWTVTNFSLTTPTTEFSPAFLVLNQGIFGDAFEGSSSNLLRNANFCAFNVPIGHPRKWQFFGNIWDGSDMQVSEKARGKSISRSSNRGNQGFVGQYGQIIRPFVTLS